MKLLQLKYTQTNHSFFLDLWSNNFSSLLMTLYFFIFQAIFLAISGSCRSTHAFIQSKASRVFRRLSMALLPWKNLERVGTKDFGCGFFGISFITCKFGLKNYLFLLIFFVKFQPCQMLGPFLNIYKFRFIQYFNFYSISGGASYFFIFVGFWGFGVT